MSTIIDTYSGTIPHKCKYRITIDNGSGTTVTKTTDDIVVDRLFGLSGTIDSLDVYKNQDGTHVVLARVTTSNSDGLIYNARLRIVNDANASNEMFSSIPTIQNGGASISLNLVIRDVNIQTNATYTVELQLTPDNFLESSKTVASSSINTATLNTIPSITQPGDGATVGDSVDIQWNANDITNVTHWKIELRDSGNTLITSTANLDPGARQYTLDTSSYTFTNAKLLLLWDVNYGGDPSAAFDSTYVTISKSTDVTETESLVRENDSIKIITDYPATIYRSLDGTNYSEIYTETVYDSPGELVVSYNEETRYLEALLVSNLASDISRYVWQLSNGYRFPNPRSADPGKVLINRDGFIRVTVGVEYASGLKWLYTTSILVVKYNG